ncbi:MAG: hypothetical protein RIF41_41060 [Polyangiaceae bacterium]
MSRRRRVRAQPSADILLQTQNRPLARAVEQTRRDINSQPVEVRLVWPRPADSAAADVSTDGLWVSRDNFALTRVAILPEVSIAKDAANYATFLLQAFDVDGSQLVRPLANLDTSQRRFQAWSPREFELDAPGFKSSVIPAGWVLRLLVGKVGSGVQLGRLHVLIEAEEHTPVRGRRR